MRQPTIKSGKIHWFNSEYNINVKERGKIMVKKFLLVNLDKFADKSPEVLKNKPLSEVKKLATYDFTAEELAEFINNTLDIINFFTYPYEVEDVDKPCIEVDLTEGEWHDAVINNELLVHIKRENIGYSVDLYNKNDLSADGYISSAIAFDDDFVHIYDDNCDEEV